MIDSGLRPRVLMFVPNYPYPVVGGLERQAHELSKILVHHLGVSVQVLSGRFDAKQASAESVEGVPVTRMRWSAHRWVRFLCSPFDIFSHLWRKRHEYDVIHLHQHSSVGLFVIVVARLLGKPILTKLPNVADLGLPGLRKKVFGRLRLAVLLRSSGVVAMSVASIEELTAEGYPCQRILTIPNGIALRPECITMNDVHHDRCRVVFVGRLSQEKDLNTLLHAWANVQQRTGCPARLELWGEGPLKSELVRLCYDLGIEASVVFAGHVADVRARLRDVDVFVLPSFAEGNSNAVLEAMEACLPIVATKVGGTPMQVGQEGAGLLFPVGDVSRLAERLRMLVSDPELRRTHGRAMRQRITCYFDLAKVGEAYLCAYRKLVGGSDVDLSGCGRLPEVDSECAV